jgi:hypothetical protein
MRNQAVLGAAAAFLVLLTTPSSVSAATPKACDLLTAQTAAMLVGGPVNAPFDMQGMACSYITKTGSATVTLSVVDQPGLSGSDFMRSMQASAGQGGTMELIPGLGEQNVFLVRTSGQNSLMVLCHQKTLSFGVQRKMTPELKAQMIQVMKQLVAKI